MKKIVLALGLGLAMIGSASAGSLGPCTDTAGHAFPADKCASYWRVAAHAKFRPVVGDISSVTAGDISPAFMRDPVEYSTRQGGN